MRVAVTGIGMVNALGNTSKTVWNNLFLKTCGIQNLELSTAAAIGGKPNFSQRDWESHIKVTTT